MFKRLLNRFMLLEGEAGAGGAPAGGAPAAAPAAAAEAPATSTPAGDGLTPPPSLLNDAPAEGETKAPEGETKPETAETKPEEPIKYEPFKMPEGVTLDEKQLGEFTKIAAEAKLPQDVAQKMVDMYTAEMKQVSEAPMRAWTELQNQWRDEVKNDPVIGGANLDKNLASTKAGLNALLGEEAKTFFEALSVTGAGNNPAIIRGLFKAAAPHAPATPVNGSPGSGAPKSAGATLYPKMAGLGNGHDA